MELGICPFRWKMYDDQTNVMNGHHLMGAPNEIRIRGNDSRPAGFSELGDPVLVVLTTLICLNYAIKLDVSTYGRGADASHHFDRHMLVRPYFHASSASNFTASSTSTAFMPKALATLSYLPPSALKVRKSADVGMCWAEITGWPYA